MAPDALGWHAELALDASHDWNLQLGDEAGTWRLRGRLPRGQHAAHLGPALEPQNARPDNACFHCGEPLPPPPATATLPATPPDLCFDASPAPAQAIPTPHPRHHTH